MEQAKRTAPAFEAQYLLNLEKWIEEEVNLQLFATKDAYRLNNSATNAPCLPGCKEIKVNNLPEALSWQLVSDTIKPLLPLSILGSLEPHFLEAKQNFVL